MTETNRNKSHPAECWKLTDTITHPGELSKELAPVNLFAV
jgi:hypothetical protein